MKRCLYRVTIFVLITCLLCLLIQKHHNYKRTQEEAAVEEVPLGWSWEECNMCRIKADDHEQGVHLIRTISDVTLNQCKIHCQHEELDCTGVTFRTKTTLGPQAPWWPASIPDDYMTKQHHDPALDPDFMRQRAWLCLGRATGRHTEWKNDPEHEYAWAGPNPLQKHFRPHEQRVDRWHSISELAPGERHTLCQETQCCRRTRRVDDAFITGTCDILGGNVDLSKSRPSSHLTQGITYKLKSGFARGFRYERVKMPELGSTATADPPTSLTPNFWKRRCIDDYSGIYTNGAYYDGCEINAKPYWCCRRDTGNRPHVTGVPPLPTNTQETIDLLTRDEKISENIIFCNMHCRHGTCHCPGGGAIENCTGDVSCIEPFVAGSLLGHVDRIPLSVLPYFSKITSLIYDDQGSFELPASRVKLVVDAAQIAEKEIRR